MPYLPVLRRRLGLVCLDFAEDVGAHTSTDAGLQLLGDAFVWLWCGADTGFKDSLGGG